MSLTTIFDAAWTGMLYVVPFLIILMVIVWVHELGHFLAARWCGIPVATFSLGFGRELVGYTDRHGTRWRLAALPLGGYVSFTPHEPAAAAAANDLAAASAPDGGTAAAPMPDHPLRSAPLMHRVAIVAAGPLANFLFAFVVYVGLGFVVGTREAAPRIGFVEANSPAAAAGLASGDVIQAIGGHSITEWRDIDRVLHAENNGGALAVSVVRGGKSLEVAVTPRIVERDAGLGRKMSAPDIGIEPELPAVIGRVLPGMPSEAAGLMPGDRVVAAGGAPVSGYRALVAVIEARPGQRLDLSIVRDGKPVELSAVLTVGQRQKADGTRVEVGRLGIAAAEPAARPLAAVDAVVYGARETGRVIKETWAAMRSIVTSREGREQVGGPIMMAEATAEMAKFGPATLVMWLAVLSVNLGLFNLLPIPILDGGHLMFYALEAIRRRPLSRRAEELSLRVGLALIGGFFILVNLSDIFRVGQRLLG